MKGLDPLVVGVDGSDMSANALAWAADRAAEGASVHVVHGVSPAVELGSAVIGRDREAIYEKARRSLEGEWTDAVRGRSISLHAHLIDDDPADAMLGVVASSGAAAVVVGAHGSGQNRHFLGRVTRKLLRRSHVPVVVVKPYASDRPAEERPVVACVGYGEASTEAALWAADYAAAAGLPLRLLHAVGYRPMYPADSPSDTLASYLGSDVAIDWARSDLDDLCEQILDRQPDLTVTTFVDRGPAVASIETASAEAELVVLGRRHSGRITRSVISPRIQQSVVRAMAPVAIVPLCADSR